VHVLTMLYSATLLSIFVPSYTWKNDMCHLHKEIPWYIGTSLQSISKDKNLQSLSHIEKLLPVSL